LEPSPWDIALPLEGGHDADRLFQGCQRINRSKPAALTQGVQDRTLDLLGARDL
jgi:hypothetical protein